MFWKDSAKIWRYRIYLEALQDLTILSESWFLEPHFELDAILLNKNRSGRYGFNQLYLIIFMRKLIMMHCAVPLLEQLHWDVLSFLFQLTNPEMMFCMSQEVWLARSCWNKKSQEFLASPKQILTLFTEKGFLFFDHIWRSVGTRGYKHNQI